MKNNYLKNNNITRSNYKSDRKKYNSLFYERNNPYWNELHKCIVNNSNKISLILMNFYHCTKNNLYDVYEINDADYYKISRDGIDDDDYYLEENTEKKSNTTASKLYYKLKKGEATIMDLEVRWKGNPFPSPQFQST